MMTLEEFEAGMRAAFAPEIDYSFLVLLVSGLIALYFTVRFVKILVRNSRQEREVLEIKKLKPSEILQAIKKFNPVHKKIVFDIIADYKKSEIAAQNIPAAVLQGFAEYFFLHENRLAIDPVLARKLAPGIFPLKRNDPVEIRIFQTDRFYTIERNVIALGFRTFEIEIPEDQKLFFGKGKRLHVSYLSNNVFVNGESEVVSVKPSGSAVLTLPRKLSIAQERHYPRVSIKNLMGYIREESGPGNEKIEVELIDISMEGAKIYTKKALNENTFYLFGFEDSLRAPGVVFQNIESVISKRFILDDGTGYGLLFVHLDLDTKQKLNTYLQTYEHRA